MESNGASLKPVPPASTPTARPDSAQPAAATTLPKDKVVTPTQASEETGKVRERTGSPAGKKDDRSADREDDREIKIHPETREVLFRITDAQTGMVRWQVPAEALLNMRAYNTETGMPTTTSEPSEPEAEKTGSRLMREL